MERTASAAAHGIAHLGDARVIHDFWWQNAAAKCRSAFSGRRACRSWAPKLPAQLPPGWTTNCPKPPGVYRFYGEDGALLYIGSSNSLRGKILSQLSFRAPGRPEGSPLAAQVRRVDWFDTAGELGALLLESAWIRRSSRFTTGTREQRAMCDLAPAERLGRVDIQPIDSVEPQPIWQQSFGVFHSPKDARKALTEIARAHQLCLKVLGLEQSEGSCFALQVGKCRGACVGKEPLILHTMRLQLALSALKIKAGRFRAASRCANATRAAGRAGRSRAAASCTCSITGCISARRAPRSNSPRFARRPELSHSTSMSTRFWCATWQDIPTRLA